MKKTTKFGDLSGFLKIAAIGGIAYVAFMYGFFVGLGMWF